MPVCTEVELTPLFIAFIQGMLKQVQHDGNMLVKSKIGSLLLVGTKPEGSAEPTN